MTDAAVIVACPKCSTKLKLKGDVAGRKVKCPKCEVIFKIGTPKPTEAAPPIAPAPTAEASAPRVRPKKKVANLAGGARPARNRVAPKSTTSKAATNDAASPARRKKKKRKRNPAPADDWDTDDYGYDDFGGEFDDDFDDGGFDDGYEDYGAPESLPTRKTKTKTKSKKGKSKSAAKSDESSLQDSIHKLGVPGWLLCGGVAGAISAVLTTLTGYTDFGFLTSIMSIVTGTMVGGAVRFAASPSQGWGPGIVGVVIALAAILVGKSGSWYVWFNHNADPEDVWTMSDEVESATTEDALINAIAYEVQAEWLKENKITNEQIAQHWDTVTQEMPDDIDDVEIEASDYTGEHLPAVWAEAKQQWNAKSDDEKAAAKEEVIRNIKIDWIGEEAADMDLAEAEKLSAEQEEEGNVKLAIIAAIGNCFLPLHALFCFFSGLWGAFKLSAGLVPGG